MWKNSYQMVYRSHFILRDILVQRSRTPAKSKMELLGTTVNDLLTILTKSSILEGVAFLDWSLNMSFKIS